MPAIPSFRAAHLLPYVNYLRQVGTPVERLLTQARLPTLFEDNLQAYLPLLQALDFLTAASRLEGIDELGLAAIERLEFADLSPSFVRAARAAPTLRVALETYCHMGTLENSNICFWPVYEAKQARICAALNAAGPPEGLRSAEWSQNMTLVAVVRAFAGTAWDPPEMALSSCTPVSHIAKQRFPNTRFLVGQKVTWITLPRSMLSLAPRVDTARSAHAIVEESVDESPMAEDLTTSLKQLLRPYLQDGYPNIKLAAEIAGASVRTLQRRLSKVGLSYSGLVQQLRFEAAAQLLKNPDIKMIDAAYELGWGSPTTFTRAFHNIAGVSPSEYRNQELNVGSCDLAADRKH